MKTQKEIFKWLKENCGKHCLGGLTSTDTCALVASVNLSNLISYPSADAELFAAYRAIVNQMQPHNRYQAVHAIAIELDWSHRFMIWAAAKLDEADMPKHKASWEPGGTAREAAYH